MIKSVLNILSFIVSLFKKKEEDSSKKEQADFANAMDKLKDEKDPRNLSKFLSDL